VIPAAECARRGAYAPNAPNREPAPSSDYPFDDLIAVPSRTRADVYHFVHVNVLAGCTDGCSCEAGQRGEICWARREVDANEGSWGFRRCVECGALCWLGRWHSGSGYPIAIFLCPRDGRHSGHQRAEVVLYQTGAFLQ